MARPCLLLSPILLKNTNKEERVRVNATITANQKSSKPVVIKWSCEDLGEAISTVALSPHQSKLQFGLNSELVYEWGIKANMLSEGHTYTFVLQAAYMDVYKDNRNSSAEDILALADSASFSSVSVDIVINGPPSNGELTINPMDGIALNTTFTFETFGWVDDEEDLPLSYSILCYRMGRDLDATLVSTMSEINHVESTLAQGHASKLCRRVS